MKKKTVEERLKESGYNLDKGPASKTYIKIWNEAIDEALKKLMKGGCDGHAFKRVEELRK